MPPEGWDRERSGAAERRTPQPRRGPGPSHCCLQRAGSATWMYADDAAGRLGSAAGAAPAERWTPQPRRGPGPKERTHWWRTRRGRGYMLHTTEGLAEGQSRSIGGTSTDWGRRGGTGGGPEPKDIKGPAGGVMSRLRCGRSSDSDGRDLRFAGLVQPWAASLDAPMERGERCRPDAVGSG